MTNSSAHGNPSRRGFVGLVLQDSVAENFYVESGRLTQEVSSQASSIQRGL